jgi:tetratricopeptide (TPR) repeat protein
MAIFADLFASRRALPYGEDWREGALRYGLASAREGRLDDAIRALSLGLAAAPAATPDLAEPWMRLGECLAEKGTWRDAYAAYASALRADPNSEEAAVEMLHAARRFEGRGEIADAVNAVYRIDSLNAEANEALGAGHQAVREYREAAVHYRRVAKAHPADPRAWENLGNALAMVPDFKAASAPLQTALDLGAQSDEVFINRARAYRAEGEKDMAASILRFLLGRDPHDYLASLWSAKFAEEDGFPETATDLYRKTARLRAPRTPWPELAQAHLPSPRETKTSALSD